MTSLLSTFAPFGELITDKKLADKDLLAQPIVLPAQQSQAFESDKLPIVFSISAQGHLSVSLFNDENDKDDLNLIDYQADNALSFDPAQEAYLKYDVQVYPKSNLAGTIGDLGMEINRERGIQLSFYRKHSNKTSIKEATLGDLPHFPTFFMAKDLGKLRAQDAFAYSVEGELRASGEISWSDMLSKSVNFIPSLLSKALTVDLSISPKLTAKFDISIKDHFSYVLRRNANGSYAVSIAKIKNSAISGGVGASIGIILSNPEAFEKQVEELLESACTSLLSKSPKYIGKALEATNSGEATSVEMAVVEKLAELLGLEDWENSLDGLKQKWEDFQAKFKNGIKASAESGAVLTFSYEFKRIKEGKEVLKASFPNAGEVGKYHGDFLKLDMKPFLMDVSAGETNGVSIETYFNQTKIVTESAWGFGLKIWNKDFLQGKDFKKREFIITKDIREHQQVSLTAVRGYDWKFGGGSGKWLSQWESSMPSFSLALEPRLTEFEFGWTLKYFADNVKVKSDADLKKLLDSGANWGCVSPKEIESLAQKHFPTLSKERVGFQKQIYFPDAVLKAVYQQLHFRGFDEAVKKMMAKSMAASLAYLGEFPERSNPELREKLYAPVWYYFLNHSKTTSRSLAQISSKHLEKQIPNSNLSKFEKRAGNDNQGIWLADVAFVHPNLYDDLLSCLSGMKDLGEGLQLGLALGKQLERGYGKIENFLGQSYYLEVCGNFLLRAVADNPFAKDTIQKAISISHGEEDKAQIIHIGMI